MTQYDTSNVKLSKSELNQLKSGKKNCTKRTFLQMLLVILTMRTIFSISYY